MAAIQLLFKSGSVPDADIGYSAEDRRPTSLSSAPVLRRSLRRHWGMRGTARIMFWFVPKELFLCSSWASRAPPLSHQLHPWGHLRTQDCYWLRHPAGVKATWGFLTSQASKHEAWLGVGQGHEYVTGLLACYSLFFSQTYFALKEKKIL